MKGAYFMPNGEHKLKAGISDEPRTEPLNICPNSKTNVISRLFIRVVAWIYLNLILDNDVLLQAVCLCRIKTDDEQNTTIETHHLNKTHTHNKKKFSFLALSLPPEVTLL